MSREELEKLRKRKRLAELEKKSSGQAVSTEDKSFVEIGKEAMTGPGMPEAPSEMFGTPDADNPDVEITRSLAAKFGAQNGLTGGWDENIRAAGDTVNDVLEAAATGLMKKGIQGTVDSLPDIKDTFDANLAAEKQIEAKAREKYPHTYNMTDLAGTITGEVATFGMAKALKGGKAIKGFDALMTQTGFGLVHGLGRTEEDTIEGMAKDTAIEVGLATVPVAGQMVGKTRLGTKAVQAVGQAAEKTMVPSFLRFLGAKVDTFEASVREFGKDAVDVAERVLGMTNSKGEKIINVRAPRKQILTDVQKEADSAGREMKMLLTEADQINQKGEPMGVRHLYAKLKAELFHDQDGGVYKSLDQKKIGAFKNLEEEIYANLFDVSQDEVEKVTGRILKKNIPNDMLQFTTMHDYISDQFRYSRGAIHMPDSIGKDVMMARKRVAQIAHEHLDNQIVTIADSNLLTRYKDARTKFGDLKTIEDALDVSMGKNKAKEILRSMFRDKLFVVGSMAGAAGLSLQDPAVGGALGVASAMGMIATSRRVNGIVAQSASRVAKAFKMNPDKYGNIAAKLAAASAVSSEAFMDQMYLTSATVDLMEKPLARTTEDVFKRRSQILTIVSDIDEEMGNNLRKAIDESNTTEIGSIMTQLSMKAQPGLIEEGVGWDGVAWDPGTQEAVEKSLRKHLTPREQTLLIPRFREDKKIPPEYYGKASPNPINRLAYVKRRNKIDKPVL